MFIQGGGLHGSKVSGWHDHRIVIALTVAGLAVGGTTIDNAKPVAISYPGFFEAMKELGDDISLC